MQILRLFRYAFAIELIYNRYRQCLDNVYRDYIFNISFVYAKIKGKGGEEFLLPTYKVKYNHQGIDVFFNSLDNLSIFSSLLPCNCTAKAEEKPSDLAYWYRLLCLATSCFLYSVAFLVSSSSSLLIAYLLKIRLLQSKTNIKELIR